MSHGVGIAIGAVLLALTWTSVIFTLVLPGGTAGPARLSVWINRAVRRVFFGLSRFAPTFERKDAVLAPIGPVALIAQLAAWLLLLGIAFSVMLEPYTHDLGQAVKQVA